MKKFIWKTSIRTDQYEADYKYHCFDMGQELFGNTQELNSIHSVRSPAYLGDVFQSEDGVNADNLVIVSMMFCAWRDVAGGGVTIAGNRGIGLHDNSRFYRPFSAVLLDDEFYCANRSYYNEIKKFAV